MADVQSGAAPVERGQRSVTISDIAREAGVSVGTVSHYLNASAKVAPRTADAVREAMTRLKYEPNVNARSLRSQVTRTLGLIVPNLNNPFYAELADVIGDQVFKSGYGLLLCSSCEDVEHESLHLTSLHQRRIDGALIVATGRSALLRGSRRMPFPCVFVDREAVGLPSVTTDNRLGGRLALEHLLQLGHRRIALAVGDPHVPNIQDRLAGARQVLATHGVSVADELVIRGSQSVATGRQADGLWQLDDPPTAVFATNDVIALGVWQSCLAAGVRVPEDVSLVGFDDIQWASLTVPPLTTVRQDLAGMTAQALELLSVAIAGEAPHSSTSRIAPALMVRASTRRNTGENLDRISDDAQGRGALTPPAVG